MSVAENLAESQEDESVNNFRKPNRNHDPQIITPGRIKTGKDEHEMIVWKILVAFFELVVIANIPGEGENEAPVYVKHKMQRSVGGAQQEPTAGPDGKVKTNDPQITVIGRLKKTPNGEIITCTIPFGDYFEYFCIANIPEEGDTEAPVYVKHRIRKPQSNIYKTRHSDD